MRTALMQVVQKTRQPPSLTTFYNSLEGNEDSADGANSEMGKTITNFSTKEALKALGVVSTIVDKSDPDLRVPLPVISQSQRELRKKRI